MKTRNLTFCALAVILAGACNIAEIDNPEGGIVFQASFESPVATRTVRQEDGAVYWSPKDEIALFYGDGNKMAKFISDNTETVAQATFRGTLSSYKYSEGDGFVAVYPYNENIQYDGTSVSVELPSSQKAVVGTFDKDLFITVAKSGDFNLSFYNVCGGIKFSLANEGIKTVRLKGNNGETLAGTLHVSFGSNGYPAVDSITDGESEISVTPSDGGTFQTGVYYYVVLPPLTFSEGFTMTLVDSNGKETTVDKTSSRTVKRSTFGVLNNVDDKSSSEPTGSYLTFKSEGASTLSLKYTTTSCPSLEYSYDLSTWTSWTDKKEKGVCDALNISVGGPLYLRGKNDGGLSTSAKEYSQFVMTGDNVSCGGNIMSLLDYRKDVFVIPSSDNCFCYLFRGCNQLTTAPALPATILEGWCYYSMFSGCTSLTEAPALPATALDGYCYGAMFSGCTSLTEAPALPATILEEYCYSYMFSGCTSLTEGPALPATNLAKYCYYGMFSGCTSLTKAPDLSTTTLMTGCYKKMFFGCKSLSSIRCRARKNPWDGTNSWVKGVASLGTFYKAAGSDIWERGENGIPVGWTVMSE